MQWGICTHVNYSLRGITDMDVHVCSACGVTKNHAMGWGVGSTCAHRYSGITDMDMQWHINHAGIVIRWGKGFGCMCMKGIGGGGGEYKVGRMGAPERAWAWKSGAPERSSSSKKVEVSGKDFVGCVWLALWLAANPGEEGGGGLDALAPF